MEVVVWDLDGTSIMFDIPIIEEDVIKYHIIKYLKRNIEEYELVEIGTLEYKIIDSGRLELCDRYHINKKRFSEGRTRALKCAISSSNIKDIELLMSIPPKQPNELLLACQIGHKPVIKLFFDFALTNLDEDVINISLGYIIEQNNTHLLDIFIQEKYLINRAWEYSVIKNSVDTLQYLIKLAKRSDNLEDMLNKEYDDYSLIHLAASLDNSDIIDVLMDNGASTKQDSSKSTPLMIATINGNLKSVKTLLGWDFDHTPDNEGDTPLIVAAGKCDIDIVMALVSGGANMNRNKLGYGPLFYATKHKRLDNLKYLLGHNNDVLNSMEMAEENDDFESLEIIIDFLMESSSKYMTLLRMSRDI